jgi:hypothetical protein
LDQARKDAQPFSFDKPLQSDIALGVGTQGNNNTPGASNTVNGLATGPLGANFRTGTATIFGLVPDENGNPVPDPQDRIDAAKGIKGFDPNKGAWGADIKDANLVGVALKPSDLAAAGIPKGQWKTLKSLS